MLPPKALEHAVQCDIGITFSHEVRELVWDGLVLRKEYKCARLYLGLVTALCVSQPPWPFFVFEVLPMADFCVFCSRFLAAPCMSVHTPDLRHRI
jgi:hypothetical protein